MVREALVSTQDAGAFSAAISKTWLTALRKLRRNSRRPSSRSKGPLEIRAQGDVDIIERHGQSEVGQARHPILPNPAWHDAPIMGEIRVDVET